MEVCDDGHEEIVYDCASCPLCDALQDLANCEEKLSMAENNIDFLQKELGQ